MLRNKLPDKPWQHIAMDFLGPLPSGHYLLVVIDYYSRYMEIETMIKTDSFQTIKRLQTIFTRFGYPLTITADNGRQFISEEFRTFCDTYNIHLNTTIPYWPQQNGEVERQNRSILKRLKIAHETQKDWQEELGIFLLMYRATPHSVTLKSPSELMFGWTIRDKMPSIGNKIEINEEVVDRDREHKEKGKQYADARRNAKEASIKKGDEVLVKRMVKTNKLASNYESSKYKVMEIKGSEAVIECDGNDKQYRRNVSHLKKIDTDDNEEGDIQQDDRKRRRVRKPEHLKDFII